MKAELGGAGWAEQLSHRCHKKQPWMVSDLLLAIREVDEVNSFAGRNCGLRDFASGGVRCHVIRY